MIQIAFNSFLLALLSVPVMTLICRKRKGLDALPSILLILSLVLGTAVSGVSLWRGDWLGLDLSQVMRFPFALSVDRLSAFFLLLICGSGVPVAIFSTSYIERNYAGAKRYWIETLMPVFLLSMMLVVTASTAFAFLFGWELMTLFSAGLILVDGDSDARRHNIFIYLLMMHAGAAAVIASYLLFLPHSGSLDFATMRAAVSTMPNGLRTAIFLLSFVGFGTKAGLIPFHIWLPKSYPIAPSPISALMSAAMSKTAVYGFIRFAFDFLGCGQQWWGYLALTAGAITGLLGIVFALAEHDVKRLLAYSSVENIGIIYLGLGSSLVFQANNSPGWATLALTAALLHSLNHSLFKSALFLGAGAISDATGTLDMEQLGGLFNRMRGTGIILLIACCSVIGLPLFNGFVGEWLLFRSFLAGSELPGMFGAVVLPLMAGVLGLIGGVAATCYAKFFGVAFLGRPRSAEAENAVEVPSSMRWGMAIPAGVCILIGLVPSLALRPLGALAQGILQSSSMPESAASIAHTLPIVAGCVAVVLAIVAGLRRVKRVTPTWACGMPGLNGRMQYSSTAFSKPLRKAFTKVYKPERVVETQFEQEPYFAKAISYRAGRTASFEKSLYRPAVDAVISMSNRIGKLQTGNIQVYLLYIFLALVALLFFMRFA